MSMPKQAEQRTWSWQLPAAPAATGTASQTAPAPRTFRRAVALTVAGTAIPGLGLIAGRRRILGSIILGLFAAGLLPGRIRGVRQSRPARTCCRSHDAAPSGRCLPGARTRVGGRDHRQPSQPARSPNSEPAGNRRPSRWRTFLRRRGSCGGCCALLLRHGKLSGSGISE